VENVKVRIRLRDNEFEAEGPESLVRAHLGEFERLLGGGGEKSASALPPPPLELLFSPDAAARSLTLRVLPSTDKGVLRQVANTLLLVLYGFRKALDEERVPVLSAAQAIRASGLVKVQRLSNAFGTLQNEGLALKLGTGKGTRYQLTEKGLTQAQSLIHQTLKRAGLQ
jgi:hypothetical protein